MKKNRQNFSAVKNTGKNFSLCFLLLYFVLPVIGQELKHGVFVPKLSGMYSSKDAAVKQKFLSGYKEETLPFDFPEHDQEYTEEIESRTATSRTFIGKADGKLVILNSAGEINYPDKENKLQPINFKLNFSSNGWSSPQQQFPLYLNTDGSTEISLVENKMKFNVNCAINNSGLNLSDYTVGENGMQIKNVIAGVDKKIIFSHNRIETDYVINSPLNSTNDLVFSEEIELPKGDSILWNVRNCRTHMDPDIAFWIYDRGYNTVEATFNTPVFYDAKHQMIKGNYEIIEQNGKNILKFSVPAAWLNDPARAYPVTIDPVVTGPTTNYPAIYMNSCVFPNYAKDSMIITIPANITITSFIVTDSYFADVFAMAWYSNGAMHFTTPCGITGDYTVASPQGDSSGYAYLYQADLKSLLACCFAPSCNTQTFYLAHYLGRTSLYGPGCNQNAIYYSPVSPWPFSAYIVGKTIEMTQAQWAVFPTTVCSDSCTVYLKVATAYGVPPYTITHPWFSGSSNYGVWGACTSGGKDTIPLTIPGCPTTCASSVTLAVPPPVVVDVCGNAVSGLSPKNINIKPVPNANASPVAVCSGTPYTISPISCIPGTVFTWSGSDGSSGTGDINALIPNPGTSTISVTYTITPDANGCVGQATTVSAEIDPIPVIYAGLDTTIDAGASVQINASGGTSYSWSPAYNVTCDNCPDPIMFPEITTTYIVTAANQYGCFEDDTLTISVIPGDEVIYIPNAFSPNKDGINDEFHVMGFGVKNIEIRIFDRWGEEVFHTTDINEGWDGTYMGKKVPNDVYVYTVWCEFETIGETFRNGKIIRL